MFRSSPRHTVVFLLAAALLLAQGLRWCLHDHPPHAADGHMHATLLHIESALTVVANHHEEAAQDIEMPLAALFGMLLPLLALIVVLAPALRLVPGSGGRWWWRAGPGQPLPADPSCSPPPPRGPPATLHA